MEAPLPLPNAQLSATESDSIRKVLGGTASSLCFGICRILLSTSINQGWQDTNQWGAACLVMDRARNTKILRVYDLQTMEVIFDEELYVGMQYVAMRKFFHVFEAHGAVVGFDFTNEEDACNFHSRVSSMIPTSAQLPSPSASASSSSSGGLLDKVKGMFTKKEKEMNIGSPSNVVHKHHIGIDPEKGFEIKNIPDEWKALFKASGVRPSDLKDMQTASLLFNTISSHYRSSAESTRPTINPQTTFIDPNIKPPPPPAVLGAPPPPPHQQPGFNPAIPLPLTPSPSEPSQQIRRTRRAPTRGPPPQPPGPPPDRSIRPPPPPPPPRRPQQPVQSEFVDEPQLTYNETSDDHYIDDSSEQQAYYNDTASSFGAPAPPPPPPPPALSISSPPTIEIPSTPSFRASATPTPNSRADLLSQIQAGKALRPVSSPVNNNDSKAMNQALPDLSSMRDSDKLDMITHIKTLLDARRDHIEHKDDSDDEDAWD